MNAPAPHQLVIDQFDFCYSDDDRRAMEVFLRDLHRLDGELREHWKRHIIKGAYKPHPDYYCTSILGEFPEGISIFDAFL